MAITETLRTGKPQLRTPAFLDQCQVDLPVRTELLISTVRMGKLVYINFEPAQPAQPGT